jgi:hypothetical protein
MDKKLGNFNIRGAGKMSAHLVKNTAVRPASKAFVDAIPFTIALGQEFPLRSAADDPDDGCDETQSFGFIADINPATG